MARGAQALYGKSPRIEKAPARGDNNESGHMAEAEEAAGAPPEAHANMTPAAEPPETMGSDDMAGTGGIPVQAAHMMHERNEMHGRHMQEHMATHHRHEHEHMMREAGQHPEEAGAMHMRHHKEMQRMHTRHEAEMKEIAMRHGGAFDEAPSGEGPKPSKEKDEGKGGTEESPGGKGKTSGESPTNEKKEEGRGGTEPGKNG